MALMRGEQNHAPVEISQMKHCLKLKGLDLCGSIQTGPEVVRLATCYVTTGLPLHAHGQEQSRKILVMKRPVAEAASQVIRTLAPKLGRTDTHHTEVARSLTKWNFGPM